MAYTTRKATKKDLPSILHLVNELAIYENEPEAVTATLADYEDNFNKNLFEAHVAECEGKIIGTTIYYMTWSTWKGRMLYLEDFVITQDHRKKGVGQLLFDAFMREAKKKDVRLVKWQVLDWNVPAIEFYKKNNAIIEKEWWNVKIFTS